MTDGLILLVFLGVLAAVLVVRTRRKMGLGSSGRIWMLVIVWAVILGLILWVASYPSH
jgi:hypothetical protein